MLYTFYILVYYIILYYIALYYIILYYIILYFVLYFLYALIVFLHVNVSTYINNTYLQNFNLDPVYKNKGGGGYLKCPISANFSRIKVQKVGQFVSKFKLGHMEYSKTVFGSKIFFRSDPRARKVGPPEKLSISKF